MTPTVTAEQAADHVKTQQAVSLPGSAKVEARQLVVYAQPSKDQPSGLELRLAWEIDVTNAANTKVYLDALSDEIIATT